MGKAGRAATNEEAKKLRASLRSGDPERQLEAISRMRFPHRDIAGEALKELAVRSPDPAVAKAAKDLCKRLWSGPEHEAHKKMVEERHARRRKKQPGVETLGHVANAPHHRVHHYRDNQPHG